MEAELAVPDKLIKEHQYEKADKVFEHLERKYPENHEIRRRFNSHRNNQAAYRLVEQANELFYVDKNYEDALGKYEEVDRLQPSVWLKEKIYECKHLIDHGEAVQAEVPAADQPPKPELRKVNPNFWKRLIAAFLIGCVVTFTTTQFEKLWDRLHENKTGASVAAPPPKKPAPPQPNTVNGAGIVQSTVAKPPPKPNQGEVRSGTKHEGAVEANDVEQFIDSCKSNNLAYASRLIQFVKWSKDPEVWMDLGRIYHHGTSVLDANLLFSQLWFRKTAKTYHRVDAMDSLTVVLRERGNLPSAAYWYKQAAPMGSVSAQESLGRFYEDGLGGLPLNRDSALYWYGIADRNSSKIGKEGIKRLKSTLFGHPKS